MTKLVENYFLPHTQEYTIPSGSYYYLNAIIRFDLAHIHVRLSKSQVRYIDRLVSVTISSGAPAPCMCTCAELPHSFSVVECLDETKYPATPRHSLHQIYMRSRAYARCVASVDHACFCN